MLNAITKVFGATKARVSSVFITGVDSIVQPLSDIHRQLEDHASAALSQAAKKRAQIWALEEEVDTLLSESSRALSIAGNIKGVLE